MPLPPLNELRPEVAAFARLMEAQLRKNDQKGNWKNWDERAGLASAHRKIVDVASVIHPMKFNRQSEYDREYVAAKCADAANYMMIVADLAGGLQLPPAPEIAEEVTAHAGNDEDPS